VKLALGGEYVVEVPLSCEMSTEPNCGKPAISPAPQLVEVKVSPAAVNKLAPSDG